MAILATVDERGAPAVAPVCPIFAEQDQGLYLSVSDATPKLRHLRANARYALHAQVGADDAEFQVRGRAREVTDPTERAAVHAAIQFPNFDERHPIFELEIERALSVTWPTSGGSRKTAWP